jgi:preprotein translocase subunit SecE
MAHKSKTQRAKASAARQARKEQKAAEEAAALKKAAEPVEEKPKKKSFFKKSEDSEKKSTQQAQPQKKEAAPKKKSRFAFLKDVKAELKRVTWPSRQDVARWSMVVVAALLFFGVYVAVLDNLIITPALVALSGLGA